MIRLRLNLAVDLDKIISCETDLEVGITTVVEDKQQQLSYWALTHPANEARLPSLEIVLLLNYRFSLHPDTYYDSNLS